MYLHAILITVAVLLLLALGLAIVIMRRTIRNLEWARKLTCDPRPLKKADEHQMISILTPALNEEGNIVPTIRNVLGAFEDLGIEGEIVVINDGSTDRTRALVMEEMQRDPRVRLINHEKPCGIGAAFWAGVGQARGQMVCMIPGDNEIDPWEILRYHKLLDHVDLLIPFVFNKERRSLFRNGLSYVYRTIINTTFLVTFNYTNGAVIYRKKILDELDFHSSGFFFQTDILVRTVKRGYLFAEVPFRVGVRAEGLSKAITFPSLYKVIEGYLRLVRDIHFLGRPPHEFAVDSATAERHGSDHSAPLPPLGGSPGKPGPGV